MIPGVDSYSRHFGTIVDSTIQLLWDVRSLANFGTLFVLVSPCFRENVVVTCQIWSFWCSLDNLLQKNVISPGKVTKIPSAHISFTYIQYFAHPFEFFCLTNFEKKKRIYPYQVWFLFGVIPGVDSYSRHFGTIVESTNSTSMRRTVVGKLCWMGTLFVLVSPCFRENVVVRCKIGSFLCSLDN